MTAQQWKRINNWGCNCFKDVVFHLEWHNIFFFLSPPAKMKMSKNMFAYWPISCGTISVRTTRINNYIIVETSFKVPFWINKLYVPTPLHKKDRWFWIVCILCLNSKWRIIPICLRRKSSDLCVWRGFWIPPLIMRLSVLMYVGYSMWLFTMVQFFFYSTFRCFKQGIPWWPWRSKYSNIWQNHHYRKHNKITENTILQET